MARLVLDTNVLVSAAMAAGKPRKLLERCIHGTDTLLESRETLRELVEVLRRPKFRMTEEEVHEVLGAIVGIAEVIEPTNPLAVVKEDPDDDRFLELAVEGADDYVVSGDKHLLGLNSFRGIPVRKVNEAPHDLGEPD